MTFHNKALATAVALTLAAPAFAGPSLGSLIGGGSVVSGNGTIVFSDFQFTPNANAPAAADIEVIALDSGLLFGTPIFTDSTTGIIDFDVVYKATGIGTYIERAELDSLGAQSNNGQASVVKTISDTANNQLASLSSVFSNAANASNGGVAAFAPQGAVYISNAFLGNGFGGSASLTQTRQTFGTTQEETNELALASVPAPAAIPSPTAALAGIALLGAMGMRRRR